MSDSIWAQEPTNIRPDGYVQFGSDARMNVQFYTRPVLNPHASKEAGRPIYEDKVYVRIRQPGEHDCVDVEARPDHKARFPRHWQAYEQQQDQTAEGTPLSVLFPSEPSLVEMMRFSGIHTIEQLAHLSDAAMDSLGMGARSWKQKAAQYLEQSQLAQPFSKISSELEQERQRRAALEAQLRVAMERLDKLETVGADEPAPRRGRDRQ